MLQLVHLERNTNLPLSSNQKRLWVLSKLDTKNPAYNLALSYHYNGAIDYNLYSRSMNMLLKKHYTLFSVFDEENGKPYIAIRKVPVIVEFIDFSGKEPDTAAVMAESFMGDKSRKPFDLKNGPLFRLFLIKENEKSFYSFSVIHHLVFDGFSRRLFVQELSRNYISLKTGVNNRNGHVYYQSYDFAELEKNEPDISEQNRITDFWKEYLHGCPPEHKLPLDFARTDQPSGLGFREPFSIPVESANKLRELSREAGTSLFKTVLTSLSLFIQRYSGEDDICIGVPVNNRRICSSFQVFGLFVDTIPVRLRDGERKSFRENIRYTSEVVKGALDNSKLPFNKIVEAVRPERIKGINPFFQISLSWINNLTIPMDLDGISGTRMTIRKGVAPFDITFYMWENGDLIEGEIEYSVDLFRADTIQRLKKHFIRLVENLSGSPDSPSETVQMLTDDDIAVINRSNLTGKPYPSDKTVAGLFREQAELFPDKTAVVYGDKRLTYNELNTRANRLAHTLIKNGAGNNLPVAILADKSIEIIVGILAILKSGSAYVPVDPDYPIGRISFILHDSGCKLVLLQEKYSDICTEAAERINLNSEASYDSDTSDIEIDNDSSALAYIMYTSGTTGTPKGSMIVQKGIIRLVRNTNYIDITRDDRILLTSAIVFDVSTFEVWGALLNGASLYIVDKEVILSPKALGEALLKYNITIMWLTSALFTQIAEIRTDIFRGLKYLLAGGDVLSAPHINKVRKENPGLLVINGYGPTENTTFSTTFAVDREYDSNIPIGKPISNSTAYVFDRHMNYQPVGVAGELYVGGDGLSKGYLNRNDLNSTSFTLNPYRPDERFYNTGDYARWLPDGNLEFRGRKDNQLKIRGFRVELGELESVISEIEGVVETVIKPLKTDKGDVRLAAFLNVSESFNIDTAEFKEKLKEKLPSYMIPSAFRFFNGFPKTINGKTDKSKLAIDLEELNDKLISSPKVFSRVEQTIYNIWTEALGTKDISPEDNFFEIGGSSLTAISVFSKIETAFGVELGLRVFFDSPRISELAEVVEFAIDTKYVPISGKVKKDNGSRIISGDI